MQPILSEKTRGPRKHYKSGDIHPGPAVSFWTQIEFYRTGYVFLLLVLICGAGGLAIGFGAKGDLLRLSAVVFPSCLSLALILAVLPLKYVTWLCLISGLSSLLVLIFPA